MYFFKTGSRAVLASLLLFCAKPALGATTCESLTSLKLPNTTVTLAGVVPAGSFVPPKSSLGIPVPESTYKGLPGFCRVAAAVKPTADSNIKFEVWMPTAAWNGKFVAVGNGGYSGEIWFQSMIEPLSRGYATASTDTGHEGSVLDASFAAGHPEKWIDFGYRAVHETTVKAKAIVSAFYGNGPKFSYWNGCSTGGRQGLTEAQRFPSDYDGIIVGAPANYMTRLSAQYVWVAQALHKEASSFILPEKLRALHDAVVQACDARDGVKDGVLENPVECKFDPKALECKGPDSASCLTSSQVDAARKIYGGSINPRTKEIVYPGLALGSELGWSVGVGQVTPEPIALATGIFKYVIFNDPSWDYRTFDFDRDTARSDKVGTAGIDAIDPDLSEFFGRGGKLIQYHGWTDPGISPQNSINYYQSVVRAVRGSSKVGDSYRLFMVPGMDHCRGGEGADNFDALSAIDQWVEQKKAPERMTASRVRGGKTDRTRPLCPFPQVAVYSGTGNTDDAANFACKAP